MQRTCTVGREGPRSEASRRSDMGRCTVPSEHGYGWAWMGMDGVEAIGVGMMAWSSFAGERASELQAVGREGPRSKDRRGQARSAAVGMLGPAAAVPGGGEGGTTLSNVSAWAACAHRRRQDRSSAQVEHTQRMAPPRQREVQPVDRCAPPVSCTALHRAARRCRPPTPQPSPAARQLLLSHSSRAGR